MNSVSVKKELLNLKLTLSNPRVHVMDEPRGLTTQMSPHEDSKLCVAHSPAKKLSLCWHTP